MKNNNSTFDSTLPVQIAETWIKQLDKLVLPHQRHEAFTYVNTRLLQVDQALFSNAKSNGITLSRIENETCPLALLNLGYCEKSNPLTSNSKTKVLSRIHPFEHFTMDVKENETFSLALEIEPSPESLSNKVFDIELHSNSILNLDLFQPGSEAGIETVKILVHVAQGAELNLNLASLGSKLFRFQIDVHLNGVDAKANIKGVNVLHDDLQTHIHLNIFHNSRESYSTQKISTVVFGKSQVSIDGTVFVAPQAQLVTSDQLLKGLLLSDDARISGKPNLQIYADDVKCAHGNTCGELDADELFYLQSRGLPLKLANRVLTSGFVEDIIQSMSNETLAKCVDLEFLKRLEEVF